MLVDPDNQSLSVSTQCDLLDLSRSACYYDPREVSEGDLLLMRMLDEEFTRHPFYGSRRLSDWLGTQGHPACREKVARLMKVMGIEVIFSNILYIVRYPQNIF